jgi:beta-lactamase regulating signal transducer with metallopeptidase domain
MIAYILKSSLSLLFLFGLYWFLLRKEKFFVFNRFFLIISIVFSLVLPKISIPVNFQIAQNLEKVISTFNYNNSEISLSQNTFNKNMYQPQDIKQASRISISNILLIIYISGVIMLLFRFLKNIYTILYQVKFSEKANYHGYRIVLSESQTNPHCFFNTIFINKQDYIKDKIDIDLLSHELEHIKQRHTLDILFIELIKSLYWFNPILLLYRKAITVNHEYLADQGVVLNHYDIISYTNKLLSFLVCKNSSPLTSGFNHSLTMKRVLMITKSNSKSALSRFKIIISLCLILFYFIVLSCKYSTNKSARSMEQDSLTFPTISGHVKTRQEISDSIMAYIEHNTSINATNVEYELLKWDAILQKHGIDLRKFNYKFTFERRFRDTIKDRFLELGTVDSIKNQKVTLKDAIIISKADKKEEYWILTGQTFYHDHEKDIFEAKNGSSKKFSLTSDVEKPLSEISSFGFEKHYLKKNAIVGR